MRRGRSRSALTVVFAIAAAVGACDKRADIRPAQQSSSGLVLLTRDGCVNTDTLRSRVVEALARMPAAPSLQLVDLDTLPTSDVRRGYPTPTLLYADRDAFGLDVPKPPLPEPT